MKNDHHDICTKRFSFIKSSLKDSGKRGQLELPRHSSPGALTVTVTGLIPMEFQALTVCVCVCVCVCV